MCAYFDEFERIAICLKIVYGEVELEHRYRYHPNGVVKQVEIRFADEETGVVYFDELGGVLSAEAT